MLPNTISLHTGGQTDKTCEVELFCYTSVLLQCIHTLLDYYGNSLHLKYVYLATFPTKGKKTLLFPPCILFRLVQ